MIQQYRTLKSKSPKYRLKKSSIPQYRKPPCPPLKQALPPRKWNGFPPAHKQLGYADGGVNNTEHGSIIVARSPGVPVFSSTSLYSFVSERKSSFSTELQ